ILRDTVEATRPSGLAGALRLTTGHTCTTGEIGLHNPSNYFTVSKKAKTEIKGKLKDSVEVWNFL
uniref:NADH-quinone oxidoreductase subunit F n=1 Tax=Mesocestoides corti TaxID=53468 RepID=A0A5K3EH91_MESCO